MFLNVDFIGVDDSYHKPNPIFFNSLKIVPERSPCFLSSLLSKANLYIHLFDRAFLLILANSPPSPLYFVKRGAQLIKFQK